MTIPTVNPHQTVTPPDTGHGKSRLNLHGLMEFAAAMRRQQDIAALDEELHELDHDLDMAQRMSDCHPNDMGDDVRRWLHELTQKQQVCRARLRELQAT